MTDQLAPNEQLSIGGGEVTPKAATFFVPERNANVSIPLDAYFTAYFIQASIMQMLLINVVIYLRQTLAIDWLAMTASFFVMFVPVLLRPLFAVLVDRRPVILPYMLVAGGLLIIGGSILAYLSALEGIDWLVVLIIGFSAGVIGATMINVAADSHIIRSVPLDKSAKINSLKKIAGFLGGAVVQFAYLFIIGKNVLVSSSWATYFSLPGIITIALFLIITMRKKSWKLLPEVTGLPPLKAKWLENKNTVTQGAKANWISISLFFIILFLFFLPDGLLEAPWENYIYDTYGNEAWFTYSGFIILFGIISIMGFLLARRSGKKAPEWDLLWFGPVAIAYYAMFLLAPPFPVILGITTFIQIASGFIQIRILQSMQSHSYFKRAGLTFQLFMATYQGGKFLGIGLSGFVMTTSGYTGLFAITVIIWIAIFILSTIYWATILRPRGTQV